MIVLKVILTSTNDARLGICVGESFSADFSTTGDAI